MQTRTSTKYTLFAFHNSRSLVLLLSLSSSVADMNQALIDDGLVSKEKIGGQNFFWSFPGKADRLMQLQHQKTLEQIEELQKRVTEAETALQDARRGREDDEEEKEEDDNDTNKESDGNPPKKQKTLSRAQKLLRLNEIEAQRKTIVAELDKLKENDPQSIADLEKELKLVTQGAHRWTDNIFICKSYLVKKRNMDPKQACKFLQITSAFDCTYSLSFGLVVCCFGVGLC